MSAALALCAAATGVASEPQEGPAKAAALRVFQIWSTQDKGAKAACPKELATFRKALKKSSGGTVWRLQGKPQHRRLEPGAELTVPLPQAYSATWRVETGAKGPVLVQVLTNPKKKQSRKVLLKKSPAISTLSKIRRGREVFVLLVDFGPAKGPKAAARDG